MAEDKRLDFDAPLLSVRRFSSPAALDTAAAAAPGNASGSGRRLSLPFYKSDIKSGPVARPGIVPFVWEQSPGRPKDSGAAISGNSVRTRPPAVPKPPPGRVSKDSIIIQHELVDSTNEKSIELFTDLQIQKLNKSIDTKPVLSNCKEDYEEDEGDVFSDALDSLSRTESFAMNCSISCLSGGIEAAERSGRFWTDPQARDFMIGRFLPAAQAMASSSPQCASHKQFAKPVVERLPRSLPKQNYTTANANPNPNNYVVNYAPELGLENSYGNENDDDDDEGEEEEDYDRSSYVASKGCGLLPRFCLKGSFGLLNPVPGINAPGRIPRKSLKTFRSHNNSVQQISLAKSGYENSWEAVYMQKLGRGDVPHLDDRSRLTSESNQLTYWSDSPTPDGSSPHQRSSGGISLYRNEVSQSPFHGERGFLGTPSSGKKSSDLNEKVENDSEATHSGSLKGSGSISSGVRRSSSVDSVISRTFPTTGVDNQVEQKDTVENCDNNATQLKDSKNVESDLPLCLAISNYAGTVDNFSKQDVVQIQEQNEADLVQLLLPPPLPRKPSESWLWRTLPSVSSKNPSPQSFLGLQVQARRKDPKESAADIKKVGSKSSKPHRQIRFVDVLTKPDSPKSEA